VHFPLVTYVFSADGESSFDSAFKREDLTPDVVFTARDADVIKTYVRMGMGVGVIASMAHEHEEADLVLMDASALFPRCLTWIGFRRDAVLRDYMVEFLEMFAPHLTPDITTAAHQAPDQTHVDRLVRHLEVPFRSRFAAVSPAPVPGSATGK
jgi:LysR family cys regulon transcriptional activator